MATSKEKQFQSADNETRAALIAEGYVITDDDMRKLFWEVHEYATFEPPAFSDHWEDEEPVVPHKTNFEKFEYYLKNGANPNSKIAYRVLPRLKMPVLSVATRYGITEVVKLLLKYGSKTETTSDIGWTAWMYAKQFEKTAILQLLEKHGAKRYDLSAQAFIKAAEQEDIETVKAWLAKGVDVDLVNEKGETALYKSIIKTDDYACAYVLIEAGATINIDYNESFYDTLLQQVTANKWNNKEHKTLFVKRLLPLVNAKQQFKGFYQAVLLKHFDLAELIFNSNPIIFKPTLLEFQKLLQNACFTGDMKILKYVIEKGADLDQNSGHYYRETPLTLAISKHHVHIVKRLLEAGADPNFKNGVDNTPLEMCALRGRELKMEMGLLLVKHGADFSLKNKEGQTILTAHNFEISFAKALRAAMDKT